MAAQYTPSELEAYLDEALSPAEMAAIEAALRGDASLKEKLVGILQRRDSGVHSLGEIWRKHRLSCPTREELGSHLLGVLDEDQADFVRGHLEQLGCRMCLANWEDLQRRQGEAAETVDRRLRRFFATSASYLQRSSSE